MARRQRRSRSRQSGRASLLLICSILCVGIGRWIQLSSIVPLSASGKVKPNSLHNSRRVLHSHAISETGVRQVEESTNGGSEHSASKSEKSSQVVEAGNQNGEEHEENEVELEDGEGEGEEEEDEEEEEETVFEQVDLLVVVVIALFLILATLAFETMKDHLEESVSEDMEVILEKLFGELTILGFLAIVTFVLTQTGALEKISLKVFGEGRDEELLEYFESVHYSIFFIMVFFVIQVLILIQEASLTEQQWEELDELAKMPGSRISMTGAVSMSMHQNFKKKDSIFALCFPQLRDRKIERAQMHLTFKALREEFLLERSLDDPFHPAPEDKRVDSDFNFGRYLSLAQAYTLTRIVEVEDKTWFFFGVLIIAFYGVCQLVGRDIEVIAWIVVGVGWWVFFANVLFENHMIAIRNQFIPKKFLNPETTEQLLLEQDLDFDESNGGEKTFDEKSVDEGSYLVDTFNGVRNIELPGWCDVDLEKYRKSRNWLVRCLVGGNPNRQQALFFMDSYGPKLYFLILQSNLIFTGAYAGILLLTFLPYIYKLYNWPLFGAFAVLASLPILGISYNKKRVVAALAQVSSIGAYRKPQIVSDVLLETKTGRVVRTFLIIHKMWYTAQQSIKKADSKHKMMRATSRTNSFSSLEQMEVAKSFDALDADHSGSISHEEFRSLLTRLGAHMTDREFNRMVATLDADNDGEVTKEEFIDWYATQSDADSLTLRERARDLFGMFDHDNSGEITIGEFKAKLDALQMGFSVDETGAIVNELDRDRNGTVSEEEFEELLKKYYPKELSRSPDSLLDEH
ncbi:hypothetical protein ACA910_013200 [Epithemia clementina (nom. ined.)]